MRLFYRKYGEGPPLIILHGLYGSSDNWVTIAKKISRQLHSLSSRSEKPWTLPPFSDIHDYESMRDDLYELVTELKLKKIFLAGHSMGGKIAISFALKWPEMINGLLIADISPFVNERIQLQAYNQHLAILNAMLSIDISTVSSRNEVDITVIEKIPSEKTRGLILKNLQRNDGNKFFVEN